MAVVVNVVGKTNLKQLQRAQKELDKLGGASEKMSSRFGRALGKAGKAAAVLGGAIGSAAIAGGVQATRKFSDLEQSIGAIESVFGPAAAKIEEFGATADEAMGLSRRAVNESAAVLGAQLQSMGFSADDAAGQVIDLQTRAADMAATFGGETSDALDAIASLMRGERDPIEKYGVALKQADINARLAAEGLDDLEGEAAKQAEAQAALSLLFEQTAKVEGQFARESDTLAGKQARLQAKFENLQAAIGSKIVPLLLDAFDAVSSWWSRHGPGITAFATDMSARIQAAFRRISEVVGTVVATVQGFLQRNQGTITTWRDTAVRIFTQIQSVVQSAMAAVQAIIRTAVNIITAFWDRFGKHLASFLARTFTRIVDIVQGAFQILKGVFDLIKSVLTGQWGDAWEAIKGIVAGAWRIIRNVVAGAWDALKTAFGAGVAAISQVWSFLWDQAKKALRGAWDAIVSTLRDRIDDARAVFDGIVDFVSGLPSKIASAASGMWDGIKNAFRSAINWIIDAWNRLTFTIPPVDVPGPYNFEGATISTPNIPRLAAGAIVKATPGGTFANIGEGGRDEAVIPLPPGWRAGDGPVGGPSVSVRVEREAVVIHGAGADAGQLRRMVDDAVDRLASTIVDEVLAGAGAR